jgi:hypothetical protein
MCFRAIRTKKKLTEDDIKTLWKEVASIRAEIGPIVISNVRSFETSNAPCELCGGKMKVLKTGTRQIVTLKFGEISVWETTKYCSQGCLNANGTKHIRRSDELHSLVPCGAKFGYDIEAFVGSARFLRFRQRDEIRKELLSEHGVSISESEVSVLILRFVEHISALHMKKKDVISAALREDGGYPLHIDATGEDGRGTLFVTYAGWKHWVLGSWKIPTENEVDILPLLQETIQAFGAPVAIMRDLGRAMESASAELVKTNDLSTRVLICHMHFLRDIGKDILNVDYNELKLSIHALKVLPKLRALVKTLNKESQMPTVKARLVIQNMVEQNKPEIPVGNDGLIVVRLMVQWILDYASDGNNEKFPFDRPYISFYNRCKEILNSANMVILQRSCDSRVLDALTKLGRMLEDIVDNNHIQMCVGALVKETLVFDSLRDALRLDGNALFHSENPKANPSSAAVLADIQSSFEQFCTQTKARLNSGNVSSEEAKAIQIILKHVERHGNYLWGHTIFVPTESGGMYKCVDRTNNVLETFFHRMKHEERRRTGRKILTQDFEALPPKVALCANLHDPEYVKLVCGSIENLPDALSKLDYEDEAMQLRSEANRSATEDITSSVLSTSDKKLVRSEQMVSMLLLMTPNSYSNV